jgi:hypothetical protein
MDASPDFDPSSPAARRRFFIEAAARRRAGPGGTAEPSFDLPSEQRADHGVEGLERIFDDLEVCLVGAHAAAAYAPERATHNIDYFTAPAHYETALLRLHEAGYTKQHEMTFASPRLELFGSAWLDAGRTVSVGLLSSTGTWVEEAFAAARADNVTGDRVMPLPFLILMKLDASRVQDQADMSHILGRCSLETVEHVVDTVRRHYTSDPAAADDVRHYATLGRWEYGIPAATP